MTQRDIQVPAEVRGNPHAVELLRIWSLGQRQVFAARADVWSDPAGWGLLLVDLARHLAVAYVQAHGGDADAVLARIKAGFDAEWIAPTDDFGSR